MDKKKKDEAPIDLWRAIQKEEPITAQDVLPQSSDSSDFEMIMHKAISDFDTVAFLRRPIPQQKEDDFSKEK